MTESFAGAINKYARKLADGWKSQGDNKDVVITESLNNFTLSGNIFGLNVCCFLGRILLTFNMLKSDLTCCLWYGSRQQ